MRAVLLFRAIVALIISHGCAASSAAADWLQFGYDQAYSGFNRAETGYPTSTGNSILYHYALPAVVDSTPVYLSDVATPSGPKDLLFVVSTTGRLLALDARASSLNVLWSRQPTGAGLTTNSSPAIDPNRLYVYASALDGKVHKYLVGDGTEITTGGWPQVSTLKPSEEKLASSLSFATTSTGTWLYSVTNGYIDDQNDYQGHVTAIDLGTGAQKVFNTNCSNLTMHFVAHGTISGPGQNDCTRVGGGNNGIWGRPGAVYDAGTDRMFITTGNGLFDPLNASGNGMDWGDTVLALHPDGSGSGNGLPVDSYTPTTYGSDIPKVGLEGYDADLGAVSLAIVPAPPGTAAKYLHLGVQAGKDGCVRLLDLADLSGQHAPAQVGGELHAMNFPGGSNCATGQDGPEIKSQPAIWVNPADSSSWIYVATEFNGSAAFKIALDGAGKPSLTLQWTSHAGTSPIVARGVVYLMSDVRLYAIDAVTGTDLVSDSSSWGTTFFNDSHWQSPIVVDGRIFLLDGIRTSPESQLWVYQLDGVFKDGFQ